MRQRRQQKRDASSTAQWGCSPDTLRKVVELASRLQLETRETLTEEEVEAIAKEVGLEPRFVRQAMAALHQEPPTIPRRRFFLPTEAHRSLVAAWWAGGWTLPFVLVILSPGDAGAALFFLGWGIYLAGGIVLSRLMKRAPKSPVASPQLSRADLLSVLFTIQRMLEGQKQLRAFLSVDVVNSSAMKQSAPELDAEYSFRQFHRWVEEVVTAFGGEVQGVAGDGMMCMFRTDRDAVQAAMTLQREIALFNATHNRLPVPFRIRCGVSVGEVAVEEGSPIGRIVSPVVDRAAALQKRAEPDSIVVGGEISAGALSLLGSVSPLPTAPDKPPAFIWRNA